MSKEDVVFSIGADGTAFAGTMQKLHGSLSKIGEAFIGLQGIAAGLRTAFSAAMVPIQAFGAVENVQTSMEVLLGNKDAAESLTRSLQSMATNGVVSFEALHRAARPMANVTQDAGQIARYVGMFADLAAGSMVPVETFARMVSRIGDMGKAEFTVLANNGIPIFDALGKVTGASAQELQQLSAAGRISKEQLLAAFELLTSAGGKFYQMNSKMSGTTLGSIATLKAQWEELLAEVGKPLAEGLTPLLNEWTAMFKEMKPYVSGLFGVLFEGVKNASVSEDLKKHLPAVCASIVRLGEAVMAIVSPLMQLQDSINQVVFAALGATLAVLVPLFEVLASLVQALAPLVELLCIPMRGLGQLCAFLGEKLQAVLEPVAKMIKGYSVLIRKMADFVNLAPQKIKALLGIADAGNKAADASRVLAEREERAAKVAALRARDEERAAAAQRRNAEALQRQLENQDEMEKIYFDSRNKQAQDFVNSLGPEARRLAMLSNAGVKDEAAVEKEIQELRRMEAPMREHVDRMRELLELQAALSKMKRDADKAAADAAKQEAEARKKAYQEYEARREAEREAEWNKTATLAEKRAYLFGVGSPQMTAGPTTVDQVRADMDTLANEDPVKYASMITDMETWLDKVRELNEAEAAEASARQSARNSARVSVVQASLASVGGGGASIRIGDKQFREAQQQTKLLTTIKDALTNGPQVKELLAVLA